MDQNIVKLKNNKNEEYLSIKNQPTISQTWPRGKPLHQLEQEQERGGFLEELFHWVQAHLRYESFWSLCQWRTQVTENTTSLTHDILTKSKHCIE